MFFFKKKTLKYTYQQRDATTGYSEVLNMKLNKWFDVPSKYEKDFGIIVSVVVDIFSGRLTDTFYQYFSLWFLTFV